MGQLSAPPFAASHVLSAISAAIFYKRTHIQNWFHTFQEDGVQIFNLFCTYLGLCAYDDFYSAGKVSLRSPSRRAGLAWLLSAAHVSYDKRGQLPHQ